MPALPQLRERLRVRVGVLARPVIGKAVEDAEPVGGDRRALVADQEESPAHRLRDLSLGGQRVVMASRPDDNRLAAAATPRGAAAERAVEPPQVLDDVTRRKDRGGGLV